ATPGSASPCASTTCPEIVPVVVCAAAIVAAAKSAAAESSHVLPIRIRPPSGLEGNESINVRRCSEGSCCLFARGRRLEWDGGFDAGTIVFGVLDRARRSVKRGCEFLCTSN